MFWRSVFCVFGCSVSVVRVVCMRMLFVLVGIVLFFICVRRCGRIWRIRSSF